LKISEDAQNINEGIEFDICAIREKILKVKEIQSQLISTFHSTAFLYSEYILFYLQVYCGTYIYIVKTCRIDKNI